MSKATTNRKPIEEPNEDDILLGRGNRINTWPGNVRYRAAVQSKAKLYILERQHLGKVAIAKVVLNEMREQGRRFLSRRESVWLEVSGADFLIGKIKQALRDAAARICERKNELHSVAMNAIPLTSLVDATHQDRCHTAFEAAQLAGQQDASGGPNLDVRSILNRIYLTESDSSGSILMGVPNNNGNHLARGGARKNSQSVIGSTFQNFNTSIEPLFADPVSHLIAQNQMLTRDIILQQRRHFVPPNQPPSLCVGSDFSRESRDGNASDTTSAESVAASIFSHQQQHQAPFGSNNVDTLLQTVLTREFLLRQMIRRRNNNAAAFNHHQQQTTAEE